MKNCTVCNEPFMPWRGREDSKFCSMKCYLYQRWGDKQLPNLCAICYEPCTSTGKRNQKYCSRKCLEIAKIGRPNPSISNRITKNCDWCGESFSRAATNFRREGKKFFCSRSCGGEWRSEFLVGENNPKWRGGDSDNPYGTGWYCARKLCLKRAMGCCEKCKSKKPLQVHHCLPVRYFNKYSDAHDLKNLLVLCARCHGAEHRKLRIALPLLELIPFAKG